VIHPNRLIRSSSTCSGGSSRDVALETLDPRSVDRPTPGSADHLNLAVNPRCDARRRETHDQTGTGAGPGGGRWRLVVEDSAPAWTRDAAAGLQALLRRRSRGEDGDRP
jgi:hypothetical protein